MRDSIKKRCQELLQELEGKTLIAISKGASLAAVREAYEAGVYDFGENRIAEAFEKMEQMPLDARWHFVGRLQSNKLTKLVGRFHLIHSVDRVEIAEALSKKAKDLSITQDILLQVNCSGEETKAGLFSEQWYSCFPQLLGLKGIRIKGLMTMAPATQDQEVIHHCFSRLSKLQMRINDEYQAGMTILSMGMSSDYKIALKEGATHLRIGSLIFS